MLDIQLILNNPQFVKEAIQSKGYTPTLVDDFLTAKKSYKLIQEKIETLQAKRNIIAKQDNTSNLEGKRIKDEIKKLEPLKEDAQKTIFDILRQIPNIPYSSVPIGDGEKDNKVIRTWGTQTKFPFIPKDHVDIGKDLAILDFEAGTKVAGSKFYYLTNEGAMLEFALTLYIFQLLQREGFVPVITPDLAKSRFYEGTGYMPKGKEAQTYVIEGEDLGLIATAEVTLAGKHADTIFEEKDLPLQYIGYSHVFRQEKGAYGKYSRGLYRVHQFSKAEMFVYCLPEESEAMHEKLLALEEKIYQSLEIPYRVVEMCTGDLGAMAARKYDLEAWMPGRNDYGEITSASNCTDYQARNLNIRVKRKNGEVSFVHMLNGTAIAFSRTPIAILENFQNEDGSVTIPTVLRPFLGRDRITKK